MTPRGQASLGRRVGQLIAVEIAVATAFAVVACLQGEPIGNPAYVLALTGLFVVAGAFDATLEFRRHRFTFTASDAVLVVGFFVVGPVGLALAFAAAELVNMVALRSEPVKIAFNVVNRLAAVMVAAVAFQAVGRTATNDVTAWLVALAAAMLFSLLDVAATSVVIATAEHTSFRRVFVRAAAAGVLATLAAAPIGLLALDLFLHGPLAVLLLVPVAVAVTLNFRYAVSQRDEHLRFERLYESSARTEGLVSLDDALRALATEARALATGVRALVCAADADGKPVGAWADEQTNELADAETIGTALDLARRHPDGETNVADAPEIGRLAVGAESALIASCQHEKAGRVTLIVFRDGPTNSGAPSRVETLAAFGNHAALIVANALMHEEVAAALARQVDLNRQKDDFLAAVSHELRTPLAVILGSMHTLDRLDHAITGAQRTALFEMTAMQGDRLQRLIDELLLVAAADQVRIPIDCDTVDVGDVLASVELETIAVTGGRLVPRLERTGTFVTDRSKLARVLLNLVENAAKYAATGPIELVAAAVGDDVCFRVVDHGPGIPEPDRERVFDQFVQLDQSSTRRRGGTGLGLHLCRQLAELLDGHLGLTETPGGGCTFSLFLPATPVRPMPEASSDAAIARVPTGVLVRPDTFDRAAHDRVHEHAE